MNEIYSSMSIFWVGESRPYSLREKAKNLLYEGDMQGTVKWFNENKGYGFITHAEKDYFVHIRDVQSYGVTHLVDGDSVGFEPKESDRGLVAKNVVVLSAP